MRIGIRPELIVQLQNDSFSPMVGYPVVRELLSRTTDFTALYAYNDLSAIGAIRAIRERGLRVPEDISVIGFDDIHSAAFQNPSLTTIRQPLREMGMKAARILVERLKGQEDPGQVSVRPELIVRESTGPAAPRPHAAGRNHQRAVARQK
jgi:LacI family transcriptional regulator